ncbi:hypothetical protein [Micromonospora endolithica]|nr:hypothetical protein [Micromonospora endolithica]TWJ25191.1 hypothetical protein JD76_05354 [Micromonospora endolithica]
MSRIKLPTAMIIAAVAVGSGIVANPAAAAPIIYWQVEKVRTQVGVTQGAEELLYRVRPVGQRTQPQPVVRTIVSEWRTEDSTSATGVVDWAVGVDGEAGALAEVGVSRNVRVGENQGVGGRAELSGSLSTTVSRSSTRGATSTFSFSVNGPTLEARRGFHIFGYTVGNRHHLKARRCTAVPGGGTGNDLCGGWRTTTLYQPTGIGLRFQGLGWSDTHFSAKKCCQGDPQPKWITNRDPRLVGAQVCPTVTGVALDVKTSRYSFTCAFAAGEITGTFSMTSVKDNTYPYDVDSFVAELRGNVTGKIRVVREPYRGNATVRHLTMTSIGAVTARSWWSGNRGTFKITAWEGS